MNYYIQGSSARAKEIKAAFEAKGCTLYRLISQCDSEDLIYYSLNGRVRCIKKDNLYLFEAHPGYTKLELPVKSKFKVGDCVVNDYCAGKVIALTDDAYLLDSGQGIPFSCEHNAHLWNIEDAKDGDVLVKSWNEDGDSWEKIIIFKKYHNKGIKGLINRPCVEGYGNTFKNGELAFNEKVPYYSKTWTDNLQPASTKQRDLLFQKIKEAGYQWDADKKELRKIKPHYDIANFQPFDKVLVRCSNDEEWMIEFYCKYDTLVHTSPHRDYPFMGIGDSYSQCIPFEGNEHLLGTTDMCDERFINW